MQHFKQKVIYKTLWKYIYIHEYIKDIYYHKLELFLYLKFLNLKITLICIYNNISILFRKTEHEKINILLC